jgi:sterol desaturase/sphingolipid hydroxylase (fatty acid hydroxylase superfamily)
MISNARVMIMDEPEIASSQESEGKKTRKNIATVLTIGIILGFLIILFAVTIIIINLFPMEDKWNWFLYEASYGIRVLLVGIGLLEFFFALTASIYIWKKGRNYLLNHL